MAQPATHRGLTYPIEQKPEPGEAVTVADGVLWLRMPLPFALDHINLWLLADADGWTIVDTGFGSDLTREHWQAVFDSHLEGKSVRRVICTHMHPDHVGLAGWLTRKWDVELWMSRTEYLMCRNLVADTGRVAPPEAIRFYRAAGYPELALDAYKQRFGQFGSSVSHMPDSYRRLEDGGELTIGERQWKVIVGRGHSPEHACLYCAELNLLISGDQVLPRISSNVSLFPTEPQADPLTEWLESCTHIRNLLPEETFVLPSHNEPFVGLHARLNNLIEGHERQLKNLYEVLDEPKRAVDVISTLFKRKLDPVGYYFATGEALAHLRCLITRDEINVERDKDGVDWYRRQ